MQGAVQAIPSRLVGWRRALQQGIWHDALAPPALRAGLRRREEVREERLCGSARPAIPARRRSAYMTAVKASWHVRQVSTQRPAGSAPRSRANPHRSRSRWPCEAENTRRPTPRRAASVELAPKNAETIWELSARRLVSARRPCRQKGAANGATLHPSRQGGSGTSPPSAWTAGSRRRSRSSARVACSSTCAVRARCRRDARGSSPPCKATSSRRAPAMATSGESGPWSGISGPKEHAQGREAARQHHAAARVGIEEALRKLSQARARHPANARGIRSSRLRMPKPPARSWSPGRLTGRTRRRASRGSR